MEVSDISFERQWEYGKDAHYLLLFIIFLEKIMQKALTPQHPLENNCFTGDAVEDAEETKSPLSSVSIGGQPLCNLQFADDIDLLGGS